MDMEANNLESGFNAMGKPVSGERLNKGYKTVKEILNCDNETAWSISNRIKQYIESDNCALIIGYQTKEVAMKSKMFDGPPEEKIKNHKYRACCLGELHIIGCRMLGTPLPIKGTAIAEWTGNGIITSVLQVSYKKYGLRSKAGGFRDSIIHKIGEVNASSLSLAEANDAGASWIEIAEFIEDNPEVVFTKSV